MKYFFVAAVFLFSQISLATEPSKLINGGGYHLENEKLSALFLSKNEMIHLTENEKSEYFLNMVALGLILESAQADVLGYDNTHLKNSADLKFEKLNWLFQSFSPEARGWVERILAGSFEGIANAGKYVLARFGKRAAVGAAEGAIETETVSAVAALGKLTKGSKDAIKAGQTYVKGAAANMANADAAFLAETDIAKKALLGKKAEEAHQHLAIAKNEFSDVFGATIKQRAKLDKVLLETPRASLLTAKNAAKLATAGLAAKQADQLMKEHLGGAPSDAIKGVTELGAAFLASAKNKVLGGGEGQIDSASKAPEGNPADVKKEEGKACVFGGHPSVWKDFKTAGILCTRPKASITAACGTSNPEKFLCNTYGIKIAEASIDDEMCLDLDPRDILTVRCTKKLKEVIASTTGKVSIDDKKRQQFIDELKQVVVNLEATDAMKDGDKTKSIKAYCEAKPEAQVEECNEIREILSMLKKSHASDLIASRPKTDTLVTPAAPPAAGPAAEAAPAKN